MRSTWRRSAGPALPSRGPFFIRITSSPSLTSPLSGVSRRLMQRRKVLLPEPLAPRIEMTSPWRASSEMPLSTSSAPKVLRRSLTESATGIIGRFLVSRGTAVGGQR